MLPDEVRAQLQPALAAPGEDAAKVLLPCGVALKFVLNEETVTWAEFGRWRVSLQAVGEVAGLNAITYIQWEEVEAGVFENNDSCWPEMALAPATFVEHNYVSGHPVVYIVSENMAILTGSKCPAGLARIRQAMRGGLASCPMVLNRDRKTWSRFYVHDRTAFDLPALTITRRGTGEGRYVRQTSPPSHYGHVILEIGPHQGAHDFLLVWAVGEDVIPSEFREAVREGIQNVALNNVGEWGPLTGIQVTITGGSYHEVDSHAASYRIAASLAFRNALERMPTAPVPERREEQSSAEASAEGTISMPVVPEESRLAELRRLGVSEPLLRLSEGAVLHDAFRFWCDAPPLYSYSGAAPPDGPPFVPLWNHIDNVVGVWEREDGLEFLEYFIEQPGRYRSLARTEQGFLARLFVEFCEDDVPLEALREPARLVGFRYLDTAVAVYDQSSHATTEEQEAFLEKLAAHVDQLARTNR